MKHFYWEHTRRYNTYSNYIRNKFGGRVQKLSLDAGFTCPNRDGSKGRGGCTFCINDAFNPSYCTPEKSIREQLEQGMRFHRRRYRKARLYMAYFQAYTNTYDAVETLREKYREALSVPGVVGLVIGTRPDCIDVPRLELLREFSGKAYISLEFGIESCYDKTLQRISRGHTFRDTLDALELSRRYPFDLGGHLIFGLPGESREEMLYEADIINRLPLKTIKFHQLQILKGTRMEQEYRQYPGDFVLFNWEEYVLFLRQFLELLRPSLVVERITGESKPSLISSGSWGLKRAHQLAELFEQHLIEADSWQGKKYSPEKKG